MLATVQLEWGLVATDILDVIIYKLSYWQEPIPIVLLEIDKNSKINLSNAVLPLCLTIYLRVKSG